MNIGDLVRTIYNIAIGLVGFAVFIQFIHAGFTYFLAAGNVGETHKGKEIMQNAILGAILLLSAYLILNVINPDLVRTDLFKFPKTGDMYGGNNPFPELGDSGIVGQPGAVEDANRNTQKEVGRMAASCGCAVQIKNVTDGTNNQEVLVIVNAGIRSYVKSYPSVGKFNTGMSGWTGTRYRDPATGITYELVQYTDGGGEYKDMKMVVPK